MASETHVYAFFNIEQQFSLDFITWYSEHQRVNVKVKADNDVLSMFGAVISHISEDGKIAFLHNNECFSFNYEDIISLQAINRRNDIELSKCEPEFKFFLTRSILAFSYDCEDWYYEGQTVDIETKKNVYKDAFISKVINDSTGKDKIEIIVDDQSFNIKVNDITEIEYVDRRRKFA